MVASGSVVLCGASISKSVVDVRGDCFECSGRMHKKIKTRCTGAKNDELYPIERCVRVINYQNPNNVHTISMNENEIGSIKRFGKRANYELRHLCR